MKIISYEQDEFLPSWLKDESVDYFGFELNWRTLGTIQFSDEANKFDASVYLLEFYFELKLLLLSVSRLENFTEKLVLQESGDYFILEKSFNLLKIGYGNESPIISYQYSEFVRTMFRGFSNDLRKKLQLTYPKLSGTTNWFLLFDE